MNYESALQELQEFPRKVKKKKLENETYMWAENRTADVWDERQDGPLSSPTRIHVELFENKILTWTYGKGYVELPSGNTSRTTQKRIRKYTDFQLWARGTLCFIKHPESLALPYPRARTLDEKGRLVEDCDDWLNCYDAYEIYKDTNKVAEAYAHSLVYGKVNEGWESWWFEQGWCEDEFAVASPDLLEAVYGHIKQGTALRMCTLLGLLSKTQDPRPYQQLILACHPRGYRSLWSPRTKEERLNDVARKLTGQHTKFNGSEVRHPKEAKALVKAAVSAGILSAARIV